MPIDAARTRAVSFDLDGTLIDTLPDLAGAVNETLTAVGGRNLTQEQVAQFVGDGADILVLRAVACSLGLASLEQAKATGAVERFDSFYRDRLFRSSRLYPGVVDTLRGLSDAGFALSCITNKDGKFAMPLLETAGLSQWLSFTLAPASREERKPNPAMILAACRRLDVQPQELVYVGDTATDIIAAHAAGCQAIAVTYGYNRKGPLTQFEPELSVDRLSEVAEAVAGAVSSALKRT
jgi:phosphoglycolate phosphatase